MDGGINRVKKGTDYTISSNPAKSSVNVTAGLVFVGYGASEPKLGYDDYAGVNVKGKENCSGGIRCAG